MTAFDNSSLPVRVICADADPLARHALKSSLRDAGATVVAEASTGWEAVELAAHYGPDVVLVDSHLPAPSAVETISRIAGRDGPTHVIALTAVDDDEHAVACLRAGAAGVLSKGIELATLPRVLRAVIAGEAAVSRRLTNLLVERLRSSPEGMIGLRPVRSPLTDREWEVLDLLCAGATTEGIAEELVLTVETVRSHVKGILRKLDVSSRAEAVEKASDLRSAVGESRYAPR